MKPSLRTRSPWLLVLALAVVAAPTAFGIGGPDLGEGQLANVLDDGRTVVWELEVPHTSVWLTVSTPCGVFHRMYEKGETPTFSIDELEPDNPDGVYTWQIRIDPVVDEGAQDALKEARQSGNEEIVKQLWRKGLLPKGPFIQTGEWGVANGEILPPETEKEPRGLRVGKASAPGSELGVVTGNLDRVTAETVISGDLTVYNSLCVGFDCLASESYGADTIRLKENNLRIHVDDTSTAASFPNQDWRLEFNSNLNGGAEYFRVIDATANRNIMTIEANAPSNSLVVDSGGRIGNGTANPVVEIHSASGDTPTLRLDQTTASGFAAQVWDVAGNETSFFVRDATNGSTLPFRIRPGAASNSLVIDNDDDVGIGILSPTFPLHVRRDASGFQAGLNLQNANGDIGFRLENDADLMDLNLIGTGTGNEFRINLGSSPAEMVLTASGDLTITGEIFTNGSCSIGCDRVFAPEYDLESIEDHAAFMWENSHLPGVGPTPEGSTINLSQKTTGILNELEKAHIFIEQLHQRIAKLEAELEATKN